MKTYYAQRKSIVGENPDTLMPIIERKWYRVNTSSARKVAKHLCDETFSQTNPDMNDRIIVCQRNGKILSGAYYSCDKRGFDVETSPWFGADKNLAEQIATAEIIECRNN